MNSEADKKAKEQVEKINQADSLIFQTEKQLKEFGDKLSEGNKNAISSALEKLKAAHASKDIAAIEAGMEQLNTAWQAASQEMYAATGASAQGAAPGADGAPNNNAAGASDGNNVSDVEYEEVKK